MSRITLPELIEIAKFWKNRRHDAIVVSLSTYYGRNIVDIRMHAMRKDGRLQPTGKGVAMSVLRLPELAAATNKALEKAKELSLLDGGDDPDDEAAAP